MLSVHTLLKNVFSKFFSAFSTEFLRRPVDKKSKTSTSLPNELLIKITSNLPTSDVLHNVSRVSKNFLSLTKVPLANQYVSLLDNAEKVCQFIAVNNSIVALNLMPRKKNQPDLELSSDQLFSTVFCQNRLSISFQNFISLFFPQI